jgi:hypothetical protein
MVNHVTVIGCWEIQNLSKVSDMRYPSSRYRHTLGVSVSVPLTVSICDQEFQLRAQNFPLQYMILIPNLNRVLLQVRHLINWNFRFKSDDLDRGIWWISSAPLNVRVII